MELQSNIEVMTASEDYYFEEALRIAARTDVASNKGYRYMYKKIGYETDRIYYYYYYVDPDE